MIIDRISEFSRYKGISDNLDLAIDWFRNTDFSDMTEGTFELKGRDVYYMIQNRSLRGFAEELEKGTSLWEAHKDYIDIQIPISQSEGIGYCPVEELNGWGEYRSGDDIMFASDTKEGLFVKVDPGQAIVLFPSDAHAPCLKAGGTDRITKIVMKVRI